MAKETYGADSIKTLDPVTHIRMRPGMYVGEPGTGAMYHDCIYILMKEVIDNSVDEYVMGCGKKIDVKVNYDTGETSVRDYGRGIPLEKVVDCVSQMNTGGKFDSDNFQFSAGMNGVGTKAVNALSEFFEVRSFRDGEFSEAYFEEGRIKSKKRGKCASREPNGTFIRYKPDIKVLKKFKVREEHVLRRMKMYCYVNAGLTINLNGQPICSDRGLADLISDEAQFEKLYSPFHIKTKNLEIIFTHTNRFGEEYHSFVNGQYTTDGGTHLTAFKEALTKALNDYDPKKKFDGDDIRDGLIGAVSIRIMNPVFEGQTKIKFVMNDIKSDLVQQMKKEIEAALHRSSSETEKLISKIEETGKIRSQLNTIKKQARERAQATQVRVRQLKDCKNHLKLDKLDKKTGRPEGADTMIFLTEGQSAGGTLGNARDALNQAVFFLRGKPLNTVSSNKSTLYQNEEFFNLIKTLDIEDNLEHLRYGKIIFATDADVDGLHIRMLLTTFFMRFFRQLVTDGRVFILETPLFRVRNKKEQHYCFSDEEREEAIRKCGKGCEITRFKGLGELNANEFKDFIGPGMRLTPVTCSDDRDVEKTIKFYMGANTPERKDYIMDSLVCDASDF
ncbi:MAG: type IIA DNA topoisomerase subunit B [Kiritimatiellae bacterium]|nr:type IIA DNA topoisomerase subunit B [Kiritimatiellia bacterium]